MFRLPLATRSSAILKAVLVVLLISYIAIAAIAVFLSDHLIFLPPASSQAPRRFPLLHIPTDDGARIITVHRSHRAPRFTLIRGHGNAEDLGYLTGILDTIRDSARVSVLAYDYRGSELSTGGQPTAAGATLDL
jgi:hypothetical protein